MMDGLGGLFSGTSALALLAYGAVNFFATGPIVASRLIDIKENWSQVCRAEITARASLPTIVNDDVNARVAAARVGCSFMPQGPLRRMCADKIDQAAGMARQAAEQRKRQLISVAVARSETRCGCARSQVQTKHAGSFAIYSGSLRVVEPPAVKNLMTELKTALHSDACAMRG